MVQLLIQSPQPTRFGFPAVDRRVFFHDVQQSNQRGICRGPVDRPNAGRMLLVVEFPVCAYTHAAAALVAKRRDQNYFMASGYERIMYCLDARRVEAIVVGQQNAKRF